MRKPHSFFLSIKQSNYTLHIILQLGCTKNMVILQNETNTQKP